MEAEQLTFTHGGIVYRISSHIWAAHLDRVGLITVQTIRDTISQPDFVVDETEEVRRYYRWFPEVGSGNYVRVVVRSSQERRLVITAYPDDGQRKRRR